MNKRHLGRCSLYNWLNGVFYCLFPLVLFCSRSCCVLALLLYVPLLGRSGQAWLVDSLVMTALQVEPMECLGGDLSGRKVPAWADLSIVDLARVIVFY